MTERVALFLPSLRGGGAERVMVNLARGFAERGLTVDLVLAKAEGPYLSQVPPEVRVVDLKASRVLASLPGLVRYLRQQRPKVLLSALDHANVVALWAKRVAGVPVRVLVSVHNTLSVDTANTRRMRDRFILLCIRTFYPWADCVVAVSRAVATDLVRLTGMDNERVRVIYNPVVTPELFSRAEEPLEHAWFAPGEPPVVLGVGRLVSNKDFATLIRAFALVRQERPARLVILGEGEERPRLEALVRQLELADDVHLPGFVENPYPYMKRAAVVVLPSQSEGFGNVLVEALALGTPVVSTDCPGGPAEILEGGKWGKLVPVGDVKALARTILTEIDHRKEPATDRVRDFSLKEIVKQYAEVMGVWKY